MSTTLAQDLRRTITTLDQCKSSDETYRELFSSFTKRPLRKGETWRKRLVAWCEREEQLERELQYP